MLSNLSGGDLAIVLVSIIVSMVIHEVMHGFVAHWLGDSTALDAGRLTFNPLKHIDVFTTILLPMVMILSGLPPILAAKPVPFNPNQLRYGEFGTALVGVAGPLTNLALATIVAMGLRLWGAGLSSSLVNVAIIFIEVNVGFFIFNMIPFPPLDGSRLLYAFAPEPLQEFMQRIEAAGFLTTLLFIFIIFQFASGLFVNVETSVVNFLLG
jgi:Zn-dependent protease